MYLYGAQPVGVIRSHWHDQWNGISGSAYELEDFPSPTYIDLSTVTCNYCGNQYPAEAIKSGKVIRCLGCGAGKFHFERR